MTRALIPGSFDPITLGHLDLIRRAAARFDEVIVAVMINEEKTYAHPMEERAEYARLTVRDLPNVRVVTSGGMLIDLFDEVGATAIVKGIRNEKDLAYEKKMAAWNLAHNPRAVTEYLTAAPEWQGVSSTLAREMIARGETPVRVLAPAVIARMREKGELPR